MSYLLPAEMVKTNADKCSVDTYHIKPTITIRQYVLLYKSNVDESTHTTEYCWKLPHKYIVTASTCYTLPAKQYITYTVMIIIYYMYILNSSYK